MATKEDALEAAAKIMTEQASDKRDARAEEKAARQARIDAAIDRALGVAEEYFAQEAARRERAASAQVGDFIQVGRVESSHAARAQAAHYRRESLAWTIYAHSQDRAMVPQRAFERADDFISYAQARLNDALAAAEKKDAADAKAAQA